jgi:hypothetical protein
MRCNSVYLGRNDGKLEDSFTSMYVVCRVVTPGIWWKGTSILEKYATFMFRVRVTQVGRRKRNELWMVGIFGSLLN